MNELIEKLFGEYAVYWHLVGLGKKPSVNEKRFAEAIKEACQAQRNACKRVYNEVCLHSSIPTTAAVSLIKNAEIRKEDYENISD